jgi:hypothetical protein
MSPGPLTSRQHGGHGFGPRFHGYGFGRIAPPLRNRDFGGGRINPDIRQRFTVGDDGTVTLDPGDRLTIEIGEDGVATVSVASPEDEVSEPTAPPTPSASPRGAYPAPRSTPDADRRGTAWALRPGGRAHGRRQQFGRIDHCPSRRRCRAADCRRPAERRDHGCRARTRAVERSQRTIEKIEPSRARGRPRPALSRCRRAASGARVSARRPSSSQKDPVITGSARRGRSGSTASRRGWRAGNSAQRAEGTRHAMPRPPPNCAASR